MKNTLFCLCLTLPLIISAQTSTIKIDLNRAIGQVDPNIYGVFMEPIQFNGARLGLPDTVQFNTLYGTLYDPDSPLADEHGFRKDYLEAFRELKITNMRWPGGNYVAAYNWQDGIGPKEERPVRKDLAWGAIENNHVGTDEWIQLNKSIGSENVICINLGLGTINDARYWVEYCNLKETSYAKLRAQYGHKEPYGVKYWCIGNEVDGSPWIMGHKNAEDYCKIAIEAAKAMRQTDPSLKFIANGSSYYTPEGKWIDWNQKVISELHEYADYLSIHRYWERSDDYYEYVGNGAFDIEEKIRSVEAQVELARVKYPAMKPMFLSVDEYAAYGQSMLSTMALAMYMNSFIRHADFVKMANFTLATSLLGNDVEKGTYKTPLYHTFKLFSNNCLGTSVDACVDGDSYNTEKFSDIPYLDVTAVYSEDTKRLVINVVNRHESNPVQTDIVLSSTEFGSKAEAKIIVQNDLKAPYSFENIADYEPVIQDVKTDKDKISWSFPAHSITQITVEVKP